VPGENDHGATSSVLHPLGAVVMVIGVLAILILPGRYAVLPFLLVVCLTPAGAQFFTKWYAVPRAPTLHPALKPHEMSGHYGPDYDRCIGRAGEDKIAIPRKVARKTLRFTIIPVLSKLISLAGSGESIHGVFKKADAAGLKDQLVSASGE
jgi:hypothetical protein